MSGTAGGAGVAGGRPVTVVKRRWHTSPTETFTFPATVIDDDDSGVWFRTDPLTLHRDEAGAVVYIATHTWLGLAPRDEMWLAMFAGGNWKVDVCLPPTFTDHTIDFCDLELDVNVFMPRQEHSPVVVDRDEFEALGLPVELATRCEQVAVDVCDAIVARRRPFDGSLDRRITAVVEADPLVRAGDLVRRGWIGPRRPWADDLLRAQFGKLPAGGDRTLIAGARDDIYVVVDGDSVLAVADTPEARREGLEALVQLTLQAASDDATWERRPRIVPAGAKAAADAAAAAAVAGTPDAAAAAGFPSAAAPDTVPGLAQIPSVR